MKRHLLFKSLLLLCALVVGSTSVWAEDVTVTWNISGVQTSASYQKVNTALTTSSITPSGASGTWTAVSDGNSSYAASSTGAQLGASSNREFTGTVSLSNSSIPSDAIIKSVSVTIGATNGSTTLAVTVNGNSLGDSQTITAASTKTFNTTARTGNSIVLTFTNTTASKYFKITSISVIYTTSGGGSSDPSISLGSTTVNAPETAVSTTTINVTYNNLTNYAAEVHFYESDGTTDATYDHSWLTAEINATTMNLDYSITANTGAARTAYLKVYALGDEGEVESSLITVTQAKKSVASPEYNPDGGSYMQGTNITISSAGNTVYYNLTTDGSTPSDPTNASTEYTEPIALGSGTTKIKAIAYDTYGNASSVVTRTYTGIALASLPFSWTGTKTAGKDELANQTGVSLSLGSNYADSNAPYRLKFDGAGKNVTIYADAKPENVYFTAKLFNAASTGSKIKVQGSDDGITFTDIEEFTIKGAANATFEFTTSNAFATTHRAVKLVMSSKDVNVGVGTICVSCIPVTPGYAKITYVTPYKMDFSNVDGLKAYVATDAASSGVTMTKVEAAVPENTPLLLIGTAGTTYNVPVVASATAPATNYLVKGDGTTDMSGVDGYNYILFSDGLFYKVNSGTIATTKAYLHLENDPTAGGARGLDIVIDDDVTAIETVKTQKVDDQFYNLAGQRVAQPTKGLYIVNGKKVVMK